jgi:hypothetical protein
VTSVLVPSELSSGVIEDDVTDFPAHDAVLRPELLLDRFVPLQLVDGRMHYGL